jgi:PIN domain nuclease of toxin-antitoxin system
LPGVLLDTHTLYWLVSGEDALAEEAQVAIAAAQETGALLVSPITAWELSVATKKQRVAGRPHLGDEPPDQWFRDAIEVTEARLVPIQQRIALEAARVVTDTGHKDPGDCFLIATARIRKVPLVTRDGIIRTIVSDHPGYLDVVVC